jgi:hypothetical protein
MKDGSPVPDALSRPELTSRLELSTRYSGLSPAQERRLIGAARDARPVEGLTHLFYRYPARFSPVLAAAAVETLSEPGNLVGDPFMGGGTTLVEAMAAGRKTWGVDISTLASFVTTAKTLMLNERSIREYELAMAAIADSILMSREEPDFAAWTDAGYFRNLDGPDHQPIRKALAQGVAGAAAIDDPHLETLARCAVLRTAQWALEARRKPPSVEQFRQKLRASSNVIATGARHFAVAARGAAPATVIGRPSQGIDADERITSMGAPRLLLTSPPYPGVHVLYHRWQVGGRRETPAPFFIANALDGSGNVYYTMGGRNKPGLPRYFADLELSLRSLAALADARTSLVQVVAFAQPEWQLPKYLEAAASAGWMEFQLDMLRDEDDGRLWRTVPNRKWYADQRGTTSSAQEVVLFHRKY